VGQEIAVLKKKKEEEKAFYNYTRLHRGLYDEVLRRVEGHMVQKVSPS
jgi:hypothetical protein